MTDVLVALVIALALLAGIACLAHGARAERRQESDQ
jgi:hypothetical protein